MPVEQELQQLFVPGLNVIAGAPAVGKSTIIRRVLPLYEADGLSVGAWTQGHHSEGNIALALQTHDVVWLSEDLPAMRPLLDLLQRFPQNIVLLEITSSREASGSTSLFQVPTGLAQRARVILSVRRRTDSGGVVTVDKNTHGPSDLSFNFEYNVTEVVKRIVGKTLWELISEDD